MCFVGMETWTPPLAVILWVHIQLVFICLYTTSHTCCYHATCIEYPQYVVISFEEQQSGCTEGWGGPCHRAQKQWKLCSLFGVPRFGFVRNSLGERKELRKAKQTNQRNGKKIELSQKERDRSAMAEPPQCRCRCSYHGPGIDSGLCGQLNMKLMSCFIRLISSNTSSQ